MEISFGHLTLEELIINFFSVIQPGSSKGHQNPGPERLASVVTLVDHLFVTKPGSQTDC